MSHTFSLKKLGGLALVLCVLFSCSEQTVKTSYRSKGVNGPNAFEAPVKEWRPTRKHSIPVTSNARVRSWVSKFNGPLRKNFTRWMGRLGQYGPTIEKILKEENVPTDLIYLAMIESGFNMNAISTAAAAGPWQFISSTGQMYGLKRSFFVDQRQDFFKATRAAARHLHDLYKIYGDWYLAFAAYNAGPGKVNSAIKRGHSKNYWRLSSSRSRLLRQETKDYVPKILAALEIVKNYKKYGYSDKVFGDPIQYELVQVPDATDIAVIAKSARTSPDVIRALNPWLIVGITPPGKRFGVYIPKGASEEFKRNYNRIPSSKRVSYLQYKAGRNETIAQIAKRYKVSASTVTRANRKYKANQKLRYGTVINIPANRTTLLALSDTKGGSSRSRSKVIYYRVRKGDSLTHIAKKYRVSTKHLAKWNRMNTRSRLKVGQKIKVYQKGSSNKSRSGTFLASRGNSGSTTRISGVAHIIIEDEKTSGTSNSDQLPIPSSETSPKSDLPPLLATNDDDFLPSNKNLPGTIKTDDGEFSEDDDNSAKETPKRTQPVAKKKIATRYYKVKKGDTVSTIASRHNMSSRQLRDLNNLDNNLIKVNQKLVVSGTVEPKVKVAKKQYHIVSPGESLSTIAAKYDMSVDSLKTMNGLKSAMIRSKQKLLVRQGARSGQKSSQQNKVIYHMIKEGDTLWSISRKYRVKVDEIKKWNDLKDDHVKLKQKIKIITTSDSNKTASL